MVWRETKRNDQANCKRHILSGAEVRESHGCIGMAANMIGVRKRAIIVRMGFLNMVMYNPVILRKDTSYETVEGCLSLSGTRKTKRYQNIEVEYLDQSWVKQQQKFSGIIAQAIQHEIDHLEGIII